MSEVSSGGLVPAKVLVYRLGSLGDTVVALPALHLIAKAYPGAERRMLTSFPPNSKAPASSAILEGTGLIHGYMRYAYGTRSVGELLKLWWSIVRWRPDVFVYLNEGRGLEALKRDEIFFRLCGVRRFVGMPYTEDLQVCRTVSEAGSAAGLRKEYEVQRMLRNLAELGVQDLDDAASWELSLTNAEKARAEEALKRLDGRRFLAVSLGTKKQSSDWERPNWRELLSRLAVRYPEYALVICGAPDEYEASEDVSAGWREASMAPVLNLCGALFPRESAGVFARARLFIGHDSGPGHLASAVQTPCVSIFGSHCLPGVWFPYGRKNRVLYHLVECAGCKLTTCIEQRKRCILSISVDEVMVEIDAELSGSGRDVLPIL